MDSPSGHPSNTTFGDAVGVHFTTASRYRNGDRLPSHPIALRIVEYYGLDPGDMMRAISAGRETFGHYVRMNIFGPEPGVDIDQDGVEVTEDWTARYHARAKAAAEAAKSEETGTEQEALAA